MMHISMILDLDVCIYYMFFFSFLLLQTDERMNKVILAVESTIWQGYLLQQSLIEVDCLFGVYIAGCAM